MNDLVIMQVLDSRSNLLRPFHQSGGRDFIPALPQEIKKRSIRTIFHHDAKYRSLGANAPKLDDIRVVQFS